MKNKKYLDLLKFGLKSNTLNTLSESQINNLYKTLIEAKKENKEATTATQTVKTTTYSSSEVADMKQKGQGVNITNGEVTPTKDGGIRVLQKAGKSAAPKNKVINDGEIEEGDTQNKYNPWAICTSSVGRKDKKKYEKCVRDVKKSIKEGLNPYEVIIENKITSLLDEHISPKMNKGDIINILNNNKTKNSDDINFWLTLENDLKLKNEEFDEDVLTVPTKTKVSKTSKKMPNWLTFDKLNINFRTK